MTRAALAALLLVVAGCGHVRVESAPAPSDARPTASAGGAQGRAGRRPRTVADSAADARALDSLARLSAADSMPELNLDDEPMWDLDVTSYADQPRVRYYLDYFTGKGRDAFQGWLDRMPRYEGFARSRMQEAGLPGDLVYIALIETGWSVYAVGAAGETGMWQFMPATGRAYGLRIDPVGRRAARPDQVDRCRGTPPQGSHRSLRLALPRGGRLQRRCGPGGARPAADRGAAAGRRRRGDRSRQR